MQNKIQYIYYLYENNPKFYLMKFLNSVGTTIFINEKLIHFQFLKLYQSLNNHHQFEIEVDFQGFEPQWMHNPAQIVKLMGKGVNISMKHAQTKETNDFLGIITNVEMIGKHGQQNSIRISGYGNTIRLDGMKTMDSFTDKPLKMIVDEVVMNSGNSAKVIANPVHSGMIDYICQYEETAFKFLKRLSYLYGEWFFYSGTEIFFGKPDLSAPIIVTYDKEITHFNFSANLTPSSFSRYNYFTHDGDTSTFFSNSSNVKGIRGYAQVALNQSLEIYNSETTLPFQPSILGIEELNDLGKTEESRIVAELLTFTGKSQTCKIKIGKIVSIRLPETMNISVKEVEDFMITEVIHEVDQAGHYSNTFKGCFANAGIYPMEPVKIPIATPQVATVIDNEDPKQHGRVKIQFHWQNEKNKSTNWIRVQTPDAGSSAAVNKNRGMIFIPEIGDQIMTGFEYGDPNRPYVSGSMFPVYNAEGGKEQNHIKSIKTRSGHTIEFDDAENDSWGITINDRNGNIIHLDTKGKNIEITAPETICMSAKNIIMEAEEYISIHAGDNINSHADKNIINTAGDDHQTSSNNIYTQASSHSMHTAKQHETTADKVRVDSTKENLELASNKEVDIQSVKKVRLF